MATIQTRINNRRKSMLRGASQVNNEVALLRYNKGLLIFQKNLLEYVANQFQTNTITTNIIAGQDTYSLPFNQSNVKDFYSIAQLRVAFDSKDNLPLYRICDQISVSDYNINPKDGSQIGAPRISRRITKKNPRFTFVSNNQIRIYPTPDKNVTSGLNLTFNFIEGEVTLGTNESELSLPRYFLDVIDDYLSYRLIEAENPELAQTYYNTFIDTIHNNIYGLNRDQRPVQEEFADLRSLYIN